MTQEQLTICKKCENRKLDLKEGLLCGLTESKTDFKESCANYKIDNSVPEFSAHNDVSQSLSANTAGFSTEIIEKLKLEQNLPMGIIMGSVIGLVGAILWGAITVATNYQIGYMAIAIGAAVGYGLRYFGKGIDQIFGIAGAAIALLSCFFGNFFSLIGFYANEANLNPMEILAQFDFSYFPQLMSETFQPMDLLFYGFAIYEGYKFSFRKFTDVDIQNLKS